MTLKPYDGVSKHTSKQPQQTGFMNTRSFTARIIALAAASLILGSERGHCITGTPTEMVRSFGTFLSPDSTKKIVVTRRSVSLVDFQVFDVASGKELAKDYVGSDAMRWFLCWETPVKLWGYGSDIGYFKLFEFQTDGTTKITPINDQIPIPQIIWDKLPSGLQKRYKATATP